MSVKKISKDVTIDQESTNSENPKEPCEVIKEVDEHPRICLIDVSEKIINNLMNIGFNCNRGSLGSLVKVNNTIRNERHHCLLNHHFPQNLHEFDIVVIDLQNPTTVPYEEEDHVATQVKGQSKVALQSSFPQTIFDPRAISAYILASELDELLQKDSILIIFAAANEEIEYQPIEITPDGINHLHTEKHKLYDFYSDLPSWKNTHGIDTKVLIKPGSEIASLLESHNKTSSYEITFAHPTHWEDDQRVKNKNFLPLIEARPNEIVSFVSTREHNYTFLFPRIEHKEAFLTDLLKKVLPGFLPELFPSSTQFSWLNNSEYQLPNESMLIEEKKNLESEHENKINEMNTRLDANRQEYGFLHDLLTKSGPELVKTIEKYLAWLGFQNVVNVDDTNPELQEEDIRIEDDKGLLVIEVKGIGGTSTDSECSQISKIKYRRSRERGTFDVFALYMVNHQRYLPPLSRTNPPFNANQIEDAINDERGLVATYDLFKLYFKITKGYITKEDARAALYKTGLIQFCPSNAKKFPVPYSLHHNGYVVIFTIDGFEIKVNDSLILIDEDQYRSAVVLEIQLDDKPVACAHTGEIGVKLSEKVKKSTEIWLAHKN